MAKIVHEQEDSASVTFVDGVTDRDDCAHPAVQVMPNPHSSQDFSCSASTPGHRLHQMMTQVLARCRRFRDER
jgi:hypothetical protein